MSTSASTPSLSNDFASGRQAPAGGAKPFPDPTRLRAPALAATLNRRHDALPVWLPTRENVALAIAHICAASCEARHWLRREVSPIPIDRCDARRQGQRGKWRCYARTAAARETRSAIVMAIAPVVPSAAHNLMRHTSRNARKAPCTSGRSSDGPTPSTSPTSSRGAHVSSMMLGTVHQGEHDTTDRAEPAARATDARMSRHMALRAMGGDVPTRAPKRMRCRRA